ncbi:MAG: D-alanyl-D-alanine carboxypeptidase [Clostridia bacterium]|nr:D-alanyl-D-alanine carboxypeptidase [Clostridia bacterium]
MRSETRKVRLCTLFLVTLFLIGVACSSVPVQAAESVNPITYQPPLKVDLSASSALVIETGRSRRLYTKNPDTRLSIPAASKIMTALLACERLALDTQITISSIAAREAAKEKTGDGLILETGDKYPLEYLLLRLLFYDSNASALAIAEQISNVEEQFVSLMNTKAESLELSDTFFLNSTGEPVFKEPSADLMGNMDDSLSALEPLQYSTVSDLAKLVLFAMENKTFANLIRKDSEYLILSDDRLVPMRNQIQAIWTLSEGRITGAFYCERQRLSYAVAIGHINDFNVIMITAKGDPEQRISDLLSLAKAIEATYIQTPLVVAGEPFTGYQEETVDGETFGLVFKRTVLYVHPIDDDFLIPTFQYQSFGPHERPIDQTMTVGQVLFQLKDGTVIAADVGPDRQILSRSSLMNQLLTELQNNRNLYYFLLVCGFLLLIVMAYQVLSRLKLLTQLVRFIILERRSRR